MFKIHDRVSAVRRIQEYLRLINDRLDCKLPVIAIDGIYGEETRLAVMAFQAMRGILESGVVDSVTNEAIYNAYLKATESEVKSQFSNSDFPVSYGSNSRSVEAINRILKDLTEIYKDIPSADRGSYFGFNTRAAVEAYEAITGRTPSGIVDSELYNRMVREVNLL